MNNENNADEIEINKYVIWVNKAMEKVSKYVLTTESDVLEPHEINAILAGYEDVNVKLIAEYQRRKLISQQEKRKYQNKFDDWYLESRTILNPIDLAGTKWSSTEEIKMHARKNHREEYNELMTSLEDAENKERFVLRLIDSWKGYADIIVNLSLNMRSEMKALSIENKINKLPMATRERIRIKD